MGVAFRRVFAVTCVILTTAISACSATSQSSTTPAVRTPTQVAYSWLEAANAKDFHRADSYFVGDNTTSQWPTVSDVRCQSEKTESNAAQVLCTFKIRSGPSRDIQAT